MPQMVPLYWLYLFAFFLSILSFFLLNYFIKLYDNVSSISFDKKISKS